MRCVVVEYRLMTKKKTVKKTTRKPASGKSKTRSAEDIELRQWITVVILVAVTVVAYMQMGLVGEMLSRLCLFLFGKFYYVMFIVVVIQILITMINRRTGNTRSTNPIAVICLITAILLVCAYIDTAKTLKGFAILQQYISSAASFFSGEPSIPIAGGVLGAFLLSITTMLVDRAGTILIIVVLFVITALLYVNLAVYKQAFHTIWTYLSTNDDDEDEDEEEEDDYYEPEEVYDNEPFEPEVIPQVKELPAPNRQPRIRMIEADREPQKVVPISEPEEEDDTPQPMTGFDDDVPPLSKNSRMSLTVDEGKAQEDYFKAWADEAIDEITEEPPAPSSPRIPFMTIDDLYDNTVQPAAEEIEKPVREQTEPPAKMPDVPPAAVVRGNDQYDYEPQRPLPSYEPAYEPSRPQPISGEIRPQPLYEQPVSLPTYEEEEPAPAPAPARTAPVKQAVTPPPLVMPEDPPRRANKPYRLPKLNLLDPVPPKAKDDVNEAAAAEKGELLIQALRNFDIEARLIDTHIGPSVTKFEIRPEANIKVSRILGLADDIKMQLAVRDVRIEAPIPGRNAVGVEIPNQKATPVKMKELFTALPESDQDQPLLIVLGKDLLGNVVTCRLDKMPHMLIAGATGSGKSVCMNSIITSILLRTKPEDVKLLLVDPKKVEFTPYQKIPHLIGPVINDPAQASNALKVIVKIMDERYDAFAKAGVRNIQGFNNMVANSPETQPDGSPSPKRMPYIVVIVDEMADLMNVAGKEVESSIQRITQLARAAGIHLIVATQRPSTDVITGVIKANIPSRIAFAVSSGIDSRTILDHVGAERLLGNGDMLYMPIGSSNAHRVQGVFITDDEVKRITDYCSSEAVPMYDDSFIRLEGVNDGEGGIGGVAGAADDPMYDEIRDYVIEVQKASTSLLQRRFGIGYNRAARMIDLLEEKGIIGPAQGSKPREVYIKKEDKE